MNNNDIVIRLRYALAISNADMLKIFKLGGLELTNEKLVKILKRQDKETPRDQNLTMEELERFMNGLIISQRGIKKDANGQTLEPTFDMKKRMILITWC